MAAQSTLFEQDQRQPALTFIAWTALIAAFILGAYDLQFQTTVSIVALFTVSLACVPVLILNHRGHTRSAAVILSFATLVAIAVNLYDGDGIRDAGILAFPIFIMTGSLMFGRRSSWLFAAASVVVVAGILAIELSGVIRPTINPVALTDLIPMAVLLIASGGIVWIVVGALERNLGHARQAAEEVRRSYDLTLEAWGRILEHRDRDIRGHTERVAALTERLARRVGIAGPALVDLRRGALLHDIGKLAVPDSILLKKEPLTEEDWRVIHEHPARAHEVLSPIPYLQDAMDIPWCHHECWDGTGYPRGLSGENIPLAARVFAVVDVWDALTSDRPYRPALESQKAIDLIRSEAGTHFDPRVVDAFLSLQAEEAGD